MMKIKKVNNTNNDLHLLVKQLDDFFEQQWGHETSQKYQGFHQLSKMAYACVGYQQEAIACGCFKIMDSQTIEIKRMYVVPQYRRQGIATQLLNHLEKTAYQMGYHYSVLETGKDMLDNIIFYKKCGYHIIDNYGDFIDDDVCICMMKDLNSN